MRIETRLLAIFAMATVAAPVAAPQAFRSRYTVSGDNVAIWNLVGEVHLEAGSGNDVSVEVMRQGRDSAALRVATGPIGKRQTLRVLYPEGDIAVPDRHRHERTTIRVADDGTFDEDPGRQGREVVIRSGASATEASAKLRVTVPRGKRVHVHLASGALYARGVDGDLIVDVHDASVTVENTRGSLGVDTGGGDVSVTGARGKLGVDTGGGDVTLSGIDADEVTIDTGSGDVKADTLVAKRISLDVGSGNIRAAGIRSPHVQLDSGSGDIETALVGDVERLMIDAGSGSVTLRIPPTLGAELEIETGSGQINTEIEIAATQARDSYLKGRIGDGRGRIAIETGSGDVFLRKP